MKTKKTKIAKELPTVMPFGKYKGTQIKDLPIRYLFGLLKNVPIKDKELKVVLQKALEKAKIREYAYKDDLIYNESYGDFDSDIDFGDLC